jgi:hypothetical protein
MGNLPKYCIALNVASKNGVSALIQFPPTPPHAPSCHRARVRALDHLDEVLQEVVLVLCASFALGEQPRPLYQGVIGVRFEPFP